MPKKNVPNLDYKPLDLIPDVFEEGEPIVVIAKAPGEYYQVGIKPNVTIGGSSEIVAGRYSMEPIQVDESIIEENNLVGHTVAIVTQGLNKLLKNPLAKSKWIFVQGITQETDEEIRFLVLDVYKGNKNDGNSAIRNKKQRRMKPHVLCVVIKNHFGIKLHEIAGFIH